MKFKSFVSVLFCLTLIVSSINLYSNDQQKDVQKEPEKNFKNKGNKSGKRVIMRFAKGKLIFNVKNPGRFQVSLGRKVFGYNDGWSLRTVDPGRFRLKFHEWEGFAWDVESRSRKIYKVNTSDGSREEISGVEVNIIGNEPVNLPERIDLIFSTPQLVYTPATKKLTGYFANAPVIYSSLWDACHDTMGMYNIKYRGTLGYYVISGTGGKLYHVPASSLDYCEPLLLVMTEMAIREMRVAEAGTIIMPMKDVRISCKPQLSRCGVQIMASDAISGRLVDIDNYENWEVRRISNCYYHIKHRSWRGFFWGVNSCSRRVYKIERGTFGVRSGEASRIRINVETKGGAGNRMPDEFILKFRSAQMTYSPDRNRVSLSAHNTVLANNYEFESTELKEDLYHIKAKNWDGKYLVINAEKRSGTVIYGRYYGREPDKREVVNGVSIFTINR